MTDDAPIYTYLIGTAGSGKSKLTWATERWMLEHGLDAITVNLDPGAESLPYSPDVDIRDWVRLNEVMDRYDLGPNGAQVVAADLLAFQIRDLKEAIESFRTDLVVVDTPGQMELFVFRESGRAVVNALSPEQSLLAFLVDPYLARDPSSFVSQMLLAANTQFRFQVPQVNVLSKVDLLQAEEEKRAGNGDEGNQRGSPDLDVDLETLLMWSRNLDSLHDALMAEKPTLHTQLNTDIFRVLEEMGTYTELTPVSGETLEGLEDLYSHATATFRGGEDIRSD